MRLPRFRIRTLMIAVATLAVALGSALEIARLYTLGRYYGRLAQTYSYWEIRYRGLLKFRQDLDYYSMSQPLKPEPSAARRAQMQGLEAYYAQMRRKYERAAWRPWVPVAPDPPMPK